VPFFKTDNALGETIGAVDSVISKVMLPAGSATEILLVEVKIDQSDWLFFKKVPCPILSC
jgi:hypothetical protein